MPRLLRFYDPYHRNLNGFSIRIGEENLFLSFLVYRQTGCSDIIDTSADTGDDTIEINIDEFHLAVEHIADCTDDIHVYSGELVVI